MRFDHRVYGAVVLFILVACGPGRPDPVSAGSGPAGDQPIVEPVQPAPTPTVARYFAGNWNGDGADQMGMAGPDERGSLRWSLPGRVSGERVVFGFGLAEDVPVRGDFDGDGVDGVGVFRQGRWYLKNLAATGDADIELTFGFPGDLPVIGDFDGDGIDTVGVFRAGVWYLRNSNTTGDADMEIGFGIGGDQPVVGDFDGDGSDTIGVFRSGRFLLRNLNTQGEPDLEVSFGLIGDLALVGDWGGGGADTIAVIRDGVLLARPTNSEGDAELIVPCVPDP